MEEVSGSEHPVARPSDELIDSLFAAKRRWHEAQAALPVREKVRILLQMQRDHLTLLARQRELRPWEKPWDVEP